VSTDWYYTHYTSLLLAEWPTLQGCHIMMCINKEWYSPNTTGLIPHRSHIPYNHDLHISAHHIEKRFTAVTFKNFCQCYLDPKMGSLRCYCTYIIKILILLFYRLQNLKESGAFQDSAQQAVQTSTAVHTTNPSFVNSLLCLFMLPL
jgi:hypothetical protein